MSRNLIKIKIEPSILKYARYLSGYNLFEAAKKAKIKQEKLSLLEKEKGEVSIAQLKNLSRVYKISLSYFFLQEKPKDLILPKDFRIVYAFEEFDFSPTVMLAVRRARYIQFIIQELSENRLEYNFRDISINDDVEKVAIYFRSLLDISVNDRDKLSNPTNALRYWKNVVEKLNIFVLQQSFSEEDISAFCLSDQAPYTITLNSAEHENRRIFSLFHEIGHILLHRSGICTPDNLSRNSFEYIKIEKFCNQFSASLLVPYEEFLQNPIVQKIKKIPFEKWNSEDIREISCYFRVSQEVIYRRLVTVGFISNTEYEEKRNSLIRGFAEYRRKRRKPKEIKIPQYRKIISKNGYAYSFFVLDNLHSNRITLTDAADYLDTNSMHISKVESNI